MEYSAAVGVSCSLKVIKKSPKLQLRKGIADQIYRGCDLMCIAQIDIIFVATSLSYITRFRTTTGYVLTRLCVRSATEGGSARAVG